MTCGLCPAQMTTAAGYVMAAEYHHPDTVQVEKPICRRCHSLIVAAGGQHIVKQAKEESHENQPHE